MRAFASALDSVPLTLAENSGLSPIETLAEVKSRQVQEGDSTLGIDCLGKGSNGTSSRPDRSESALLRDLPLDMKKQFVYDPLVSKRQQYLLATQLVRAVLKIGQSVPIQLLSQSIFPDFNFALFLDDVIISGESLE